MKKIYKLCGLFSPGIECSILRDVTIITKLFLAASSSAAMENAKYILLDRFFAEIIPQNRLILIQK